MNYRNHLLQKCFQECWSLYELSTMSENLMFFENIQSSGYIINLFQYCYLCALNVCW